MADEILNPNPTNGSEPAGDPNAGAQPNVQPQPTFDDMLKGGYQAEFDRRVSKAIETARAKFTDPSVEQLKTQLDGYIRRETAVKAGVDPKFLKFVVSEAAEAGGDFDKALTDYLEANPQFKASAAEPPKPNSWGQPGAGEPDRGMDGVEAAFRRNNPNLKL